MIRKHFDFICIAIALLAVLAFFGNTFAGPAKTPQEPTMIDSAASYTFSTGQVAMAHSVARLIKALPVLPHGRYSIMIKNPGSSASTVYIGSSASVTSSTGFPLSAGEGIVLDRSYSAVYGICAGSDNSTIAYIEEAR